MQLPNNNAGERNDHEKANDIVGVIGIQNNGIIQLPSQEPDFSEFLWMADENLDDFDQKVINELDQHYGIDSATGLNAKVEEEDFLQQMLEEEEENNTVYFPNHHHHPMDADNCVDDLSKRLHKMEVTDGLAAQSNLNPFAAEFVPGQGFPDPNIVAPITLMAAQPETHPMNQIYTANMSASLHSGGFSAMQANVQNIMWRQSNPHMRYSIPMQPQINNQAVRGMYAANGPLYVSNIPMSMFPMMNGGAFVRPAQNRLHHPDGSDRCIEDEGYGDN